MRGIDTNILVRYFSNDDEAQSELAKKLIDDQTDPQNPLFINIVVLSELICVLVRGYKYKKNIVIILLKQIIISDRFLVDKEEYVKDAIKLYEKSQAGFSDCLIDTINKNNGCNKTFTFDNKAAKTGNFKLLT